MSRFVITVKLGTNGASATIRDVESGLVTSATYAGPKEAIQALLKSFESNPEMKIKYE